MLTESFYQLFRYQVISATGMRLYNSADLPDGRAKYVVNNGILEFPKNLHFFYGVLQTYLKLSFCFRSTLL